MNREAAIKAAYFAVIAHGDDPTQRAVQAMTQRIFGKKMQTREVLAVLRSIRNPVANQLQDGSKSVASASVKPPDSVAVQLQDSSSRASARADLNGVSLKRDTVVETTSVVSPTASAEPVAEPESKPASAESKPAQTALFATSPKPARVDNRTDAQRAGHAIRDAIAALVRPYLGKQTIAGWKGSNGKVAMDMAAASVTPSEAVDFWNAEKRRTNRPIIMLSELQRRMVLANAAGSSDLEDVPPRFDDYEAPPEKIWTGGRA